MPLRNSWPFFRYSTWHFYQPENNRHLISHITKVRKLRICWLFFSYFIVNFVIRFIHQPLARITRTTSSHAWHWSIDWSQKIRSAFRRDNLPKRYVGCPWKMIVSKKIIAIKVFFLVFLLLTSVFLFHGVQSVIAQRNTTMSKHLALAYAKIPVYLHFRHITCG